MLPVRLPGSNLDIGKNQPEYLVIPAIGIEGDVTGTVVFCYELTPEEIETITKTRKLFLSQMTFGKPFQPIRASVKIEDHLDGYPFSTDELINLTSDGENTVSE